MNILDELERFLAKYDSPEGATWDEGKDFQAQLENAAPALLRLARAAEREFNHPEEEARFEAGRDVRQALRDLGVEV